MKTILLAILFSGFCCIGCGSDDVASSSQLPNPNPIPANPNPTNPDPIRYLALGDSYTIGQSVCETQIPGQLKTALATQTGRSVELEIIATTGWTTTNLISAINTNAPSGNRDLVTLLIGVNNQYQQKAFSVYESEFPQLVNTAIALAKGDKSNLIVVSIPDYAFTPYGQNYGDPTLISTEIDQYNSFAESYCNTNGITFINITDITRQGLENPALVAADGLHPSQVAYAQFVNLILPEATIAVE